MTDLTPAQKAWQTRRLRAAELARQKKHSDAFAKARASEAASKEALLAYCKEHKWRVAFFEGATGSPRTGIIDAIIFKISRKNADALDLRLVQLKGGKAGVSAAEIRRLKKAVATVKINWMIAAFDGESLHLMPEPHSIGERMAYEPGSFVFKGDPNWQDPDPDLFADFEEDDEPAKDAASVKPEDGGEAKTGRLKKAKGR